VTPVLGVLYLADLFHDPRMLLPSIQDWGKVKRFLDGSWPEPVPRWLVNPPDQSEWLMRASKAPCVVVDTEYQGRRLTMLGIGWREPAGVRGVQFDVRSECSRFDDAYGELVCRTPVVFQNAPADLPILEDALGIGYGAYQRIDDTRLAHAALWAEWPHDLEFLASVYSPYRKLKHLAGHDLRLYNWGDVISTLATWEALEREFAGDPQSRQVYETDLRLIPIVLERQRSGIRLDQVAVKAQLKLETARLDRAQAMGEAAAGWPIKLGSSKALGIELYEIEQRPVQRAPKTRQPSVSKDALHALAARMQWEPDEHPLLEARAEYAGALQNLSHYIRPALDKERVYPEFLIAAQETGRWSIKNPPLAQLPEHLHPILVPDEGEAWLIWDWSGIEEVLLAAICGDQRVLDAAKRREDLHTQAVCEIFGYEQPPVLVNPHDASENEDWWARYDWKGSKDIRRTFTKRFKYRMYYGGDPRLSGDIPGAKALGLTPDRLVRAANAYLYAHPEYARWRAKVERSIRESRNPQIRSFDGRLRRLLSAKDKSKAVREAWNHPMQAGVVAILDQTILDVLERFPETHVVLTVHDAVWLGMPADQVEVLRPQVMDVVEREWEIEGRTVRFLAESHVVGG